MAAISTAATPKKDGRFSTKIIQSNNRFRVNGSVLFSPPRDKFQVMVVALEGLGDPARERRGRLRIARGKSVGSSDRAV